MKQGDVTTQDEAVILPSSFSGIFTHDLSSTTPTVITSVGFKPSSIHFMAIEASAVGVFSLGYVDSSLNQTTIYDKYVEIANTYTHNNTGVILSLVGVSTQNAAVVASYDTNGFTLTWTKSGSPTGNVAVKFIAYK